MKRESSHCSSIRGRASMGEERNQLLRDQKNKREKTGLHPQRQKDKCNEEKSEKGMRKQGYLLNKIFKGGMFR